jgi:hypothetical protein
LSAHVRMHVCMYCTYLCVCTVCTYLCMYFVPPRSVCRLAAGDPEPGDVDSKAFVRFAQVYRVAPACIRFLARRGNTSWGKKEKVPPTLWHGVLQQQVEGQ